MFTVTVSPPCSLTDHFFAACGIAVCWRNHRLQIARQTTFGCYCFPLSCFSCVFLSSTFIPSSLHPFCPPAPVQSHHDSAGRLSASESSISFLSTRVCSNLPMVTATPIDADLAFWPFHHISAVPPSRPRRVLLGPQRHMEGRRQ
jgi:hypothetical protein